MKRTMIAKEFNLSTSKVHRVLKGNNAVRAPVEASRIADSHGRKHHKKYSGVVAVIPRA